MLGWIQFQQTALPDVNTGAEFDGSNDYLSSTSLAGAANAKTALFSAWVKRSSAAAERIIYFDATGSTNGETQLMWLANDQIQFNAYAPGGTTTTLLFLTGNNALPSDGNWHHFIFSYNGADQSFSIWIDDVDLSLSPTTATDNNLTFAGMDEYLIGTVPGYATKLTACVGELYYTNEYLDLTVTANRRKFLTSGGSRANLGVDGRTPTGTAPLIYLSGGSAQFAQNFGSGGGFTVNGALTDCAINDITLPTTYTATLSIDAAIQAQRTLTASLSAAIQQSRTATTSVDAAVSQALTALASANAAIQAALTGATSFQAAIQSAQTAQTALQAAIQATQTAETSLSGHITTPGSNTATTVLSGAIVATISASMSLQAAIQGSGSLSASVSGAIAAVQTISASVDAVIARVVSAAATIDGAILASMAATASLDARITAVGQLAPSADRTLSLAARGRTHTAGGQSRTNTIPARTRTH